MRTPEYEEVAEAQRAFQFGLHDVADKLGNLLLSGNWRSFVTPTGLPVEPGSFSKFVTDKRPGGLESDMETVRRVCGKYKWVSDLLDQTLKEAQPHGGDRRSPEAKINVSNLHVDRPSGESTEAALRRLRKDRPDLHERVLAGELSAHAAAVEAGHRLKRFSVPADPQRAAQILRRHLTSGELSELIALLQDTL